MNNPSRLNFDVALLKHFKITEGSNLEFRAEAFNVFNHTQFRIYDPDKGNTGSNTITCYGGAGQFRWRPELSRRQLLPASCGRSSSAHHAVRPEVQLLDWGDFLRNPPLALHSPWETGKKSSFRLLLM